MINSSKHNVRALLGAAIFFAASGAMAADKELLDLLLKNGAIDKKQYDSLVKKGDKEGSNILTKLNDKGLGFESADKNFSFRFNGRLHADAILHGNDSEAARSSDADLIAADNADREANDGTHIRRARLEAAGTFWKNWDWKMQYDFAKTKAGDPNWRDMWIRYNAGDMGRVTIGNQKRPFSMQQMMSSNDTVFAERSLEYAFVAPQERSIGLAYDINGANWTAAAGVFGGDRKDATKDDQGWSAAGRATYAPIATADQVLHFGGSLAYTKPHDTLGEAHFKAEPTSDISGFVLAEAKIGNVESYTNVGAETAAVYGPFSVEGEYVRSYVDQDKAGTTLTLDGWHVDGTWNLTGETRHYDAKKGMFGRLKPNRNFDLAGGLGAWELKARYHNLDMNDAGASANGEGGKVSAATVGLNWYLNPNLRMMVDHTQVLDTDHDKVTKGDTADLHYTQMRASLAF